MSESIKLIREILTAWHRAGAQSIEWPVCRACHGSGERGPSAAAALGHANITTTTMYTHISTNKRRQDLARLLAE